MMDISHRALINHNLFADVCFIIGNVKNKIYAHSYILEVRTGSPSPLLTKGVKRTKQGKSHVTVTLGKDFVSPSTLLTVLEYIYTGDVPLQNLLPFEVMALAKLARTYSISRLVFLCDMHMYKCINMENVHQILKHASSTGDVEVERFAIEFMCKHHKETVENKAGTDLIGLDLFQRVMAAHIKFEQELKKSGASYSALSLTPIDRDDGGSGSSSPGTFRWQTQYTNRFLDPPPNTTLQDFQKLFAEMPGADVRFFVGGSPMPCHKAMVAAGSPIFSMMLMDMKQKVKGLVQLQLTPTPQAFRHMLQYFYYGSTDMPAMVAIELIPFAKKYGMGGLQKVCEELLAQKITPQAAINILQVSYTTNSREAHVLREKAAEYIGQNLPIIDIVPLLTAEPKRMAFDVLAAVRDAFRGEKISNNRVHFEEDDMYVPRDSVSISGGGQPSSNNLLLETSLGANSNGNGNANAAAAAAASMMTMMMDGGGNGVDMDGGDIGDDDDEDIEDMNDDNDDDEEDANPASDVSAFTSLIRELRPSSSAKRLHDDSLNTSSADEDDDDGSISTDTYSAMESLTMPSFVNKMTSPLPPSFNYSSSIDEDLSSVATVSPLSTPPANTQSPISLAIPSISAAVSVHENDIISTHDDVIHEDGDNDVNVTAISEPSPPSSSSSSSSEDISVSAAAAVSLPFTLGVHQVVNNTFSTLGHSVPRYPPPPPPQQQQQQQQPTVVSPPPPREYIATRPAAPAAAAASFSSSTPLVHVRSLSALPTQSDVISSPPPTAVRPTPVASPSLSSGTPLVHVRSMSSLPSTTSTTVMAPSSSGMKSTMTTTATPLTQSTSQPHIVSPPPAPSTTSSGGGVQFISQQRQGQPRPLAPSSALSHSVSQPIISPSAALKHPPSSHPPSVASMLVHSSSQPNQRPGPSPASSLSSSPTIAASTTTTTTTTTMRPLSTRTPPPPPKSAFATIHAHASYTSPSPSSSSPSAPVPTSSVVAPPPPSGASSSPSVSVAAHVPTPSTTTPAAAAAPVARAGWPPVPVTSISVRSAPLPSSSSPSQPTATSSASSPSPAPGGLAGSRVPPAPPPVSFKPVGINTSSASSSPSSSSSSSIRPTTSTTSSSSSSSSSLSLQSATIPTTSPSITAGTTSRASATIKTGYSDSVPVRFIDTSSSPKLSSSSSYKTEEDERREALERKMKREAEREAEMERDIAEDIKRKEAFLVAKLTEKKIPLPNYTWATKVEEQPPPPPPPVETQHQQEHLQHHHPVQDEDAAPPAPAPPVAAALAATVMVDATILPPPPPMPILHFELSPAPSPSLHSQTQHQHQQHEQQQQDRHIQHSDDDRILISDTAAPLLDDLDVSLKLEEGDDDEWGEVADMLDTLAGMVGKK